MTTEMERLMDVDRDAAYDAAVGTLDLEEAMGAMARLTGAMVARAEDALAGGARIVRLTEAKDLGVVVGALGVYVDKLLEVRP